MQEFQENYDNLIKRVENGETFGIVDSSGSAAVIMPPQDGIIQMYTDHDQGC